MNDLAIGLIGVVAGWGLSQGSEVIKSYFHTKKLKRLLTQELNDVEASLDGTVLMLKRNVDEYRKNYLVSYCAPLNTPFLDKHYIEIADQLTDSQRYNIRNLQDHLVALNNGLIWLEQNTVSSPTNHGLLMVQIYSRIVTIYRAALFAQAILKEANKIGGQEAITEDHPSSVKVKKTISNIKI